MLKSNWCFQTFFKVTWKPGEIVQFDEDIFQMGWFNHHHGSTYSPRYPKNTKQMGVPKIRGTPKWMVKTWKTLLKWMIWGTTIFGNTQISMISWWKSGALGCWFPSWWMVPFFKALVAAGSALKVAREALIQAQEVGQGPRASRRTSLKDWKRTSGPDPSPEMLSDICIISCWFCCAFPRQMRKKLLPSKSGFLVKTRTSVVAAY